MASLTASISHHSRSDGATPAVLRCCGARAQTRIARRRAGKGRRTTMATLRLVVAAALAAATISVGPSPLSRAFALDSSPGGASNRRRIIPPLPTFGGGRGKKPPLPSAAEPPPPPPPARRSGGGGAGLAGRRLGGYIDRIFDDADSNRDGSVSTSETYELVLKMYVQINRRAPIPPPSREKVEELFRGADLDRSGRLNREEFRNLALVLAKRASARVVCHKFVTVVCAPLLAVEVVRRLLGREWVRKLADSVLPENVTGAKVAGLVRKPEFWRTALTVGFVVTLGNVVLALVNAVLDLTDKKKGGDAEKNKP